MLLHSGEHRTTTSPRRRWRRSGARRVRPWAAAALSLIALAGAAPAASASSYHVIRHYGPELHQWIAIFPAAQPEAPSVLLVHGGAWVSQTSVGAIAESLQAVGFTVFNIQYRLAALEQPPSFPMQVEDLETAAAYARRHAAEFNASPTNQIFLGGSAGGHLAAAAALRMNEAAPGSIPAVVTLSGALDPARLLSEMEAGTYKGAILVKNLPIALACEVVPACATEETSALAAQWSPARTVTPANAPQAWLTYNSTHELMPLSQQQEMVAALEAAGTTVTAREPTRYQHAFEYWDLVKEEVVAFIREH